MPIHGENFLCSDPEEYACNCENIVNKLNVRCTAQTAEAVRHSYMSEPCFMYSHGC